jgi:hypothetical protein
VDSDVPMTEKKKQKARHAMETVVKKYWTVEGEGMERVWNFTIQPNSPTNVLGAIVYTAATLGLKQETTHYWLLLKNFSYACSIGLTLSTNLNATPMVGGHPQKFVKDWTMAEISELDVADLRGRLPEKLRYLRYNDRKQVLKALATGEAIVPNGKAWVSCRKDVRFGDNHNRPIGQLGGPNAFEESGSR